MLTLLVDFRIGAFVLGRDIGDVVGDLHQLLPAVVRLADDALVGFDDVVLEAHHLFEPQLLAKLGSQFHGLIID